MATVKAERGYYIRPLEAAILMLNLHLAAQDPDIGNGDPAKSLRELTYEIQKREMFPISKDVLEGALWAANMMNEKGRFWGPYVEGGSVASFNTLLTNLDLPRGERFDLFYNVIVKGNKRDM